MAAHVVDFLQVHGIPPARGSGVEVGFFTDATDSVADALGDVVERRALIVVSDDKRERASDDHIFASRIRYRDTHVVSTPIVPDDKILRMPLDSKLQESENN